VEIGDIVRLKPEPWRDPDRLGVVVGRWNALILNVFWTSPGGITVTVGPELERVSQEYLEVVSAAG
tara:strand:+ start:1115 stop:1312 length:198 start_codon:yes stop_codon:yes gene_type:complete